HFELLKTTSQLSSPENLKSIASCLNRYLDPKEKALLLGSLKGREKEPVVSQAIDMNKILQSVGSQNVSEGIFHDMGSYAGDFSEKSILEIGMLATSLFTAIGGSRLSSWTTSLLNKSAFALEALMIIPYGKELVASLLVKSGVPVYMIEEAFSKLPDLASQGAVDTLKKTTQTVSSIINTNATPELAKQGYTSTPFSEAIEAIGKKAQQAGEKMAARWSSWFSNIAFDLLSESHVIEGLTPKLAVARAKIEAAELSSAAIRELDSIWSTILKKNGDNSAYAQFVEEAYTGYIGPMIDGAKSSIEVLDAKSRTELQMNQYLADRAKMASVSLTQEENAQFRQSIFTALSGAAPLLSWLLVQGQPLTLLPFVMQRILPHVLRSAARCTGTDSKPFWYYVAQNVQKLSEKGASQAKTQSNKIGSWLQETYRKSFGNKTVDSQRIDNFLTLSHKEQRHLLEVAMNAPKATKQEYDKLKRLLPKFPAEGLQQEHAELTLQIMDRLEPKELLALSPTSFASLDAKMRQRVKEIVQRHTKKDPSQILSQAEIVKRFNALPESRKEELDCITVSEFFSLTPEEQENILFTVAHSEQYKHFTDSDPSRIVKK
ncbi:MAG: hypothetical protein JSR46_08160, partial [Verrucomicrobia bacterium]|nr:hypothetical protein [Verrucomicrobiota bacterium]